MQSLNTIMSGIDLLKIIMLLGIVLAMWGSHRLGKLNDELDEEIRRGWEDIDKMNVGPESRGDRAKADA